MFQKYFKTNSDSIIDYNFRIYDLKELERLHKSNQKLDIDVKDYYETNKCS